MIERWKSIPGYEGLYQVSDRGRVRRRGVGHGVRDKHVLRPEKSDGYSFVSLSRDSRGRSFRVHRLVAAAFLGPCPPGYEVNHKNGKKDDNRASNLEYVTHAQNMAHNRTVLNHGYRKLTEEAVREIRRRVEAGEVQRVVGEDFGIAQCVVSRIFHREDWAHVS